MFFPFLFYSLLSLFSIPFGRFLSFIYFISYLIHLLFVFFRFLLSVDFAFLVSLNCFAVTLFISKFTSSHLSQRIQSFTYDHHQPNTTILYVTYVLVLNVQETTIMWTTTILWWDTTEAMRYVTHTIITVTFTIRFPPSFTYTMFSCVETKRTHS